MDRSHSGSGVGLGLAIVRHVIVNHEGVIRIESTEGVGTTFFIQFPTNFIEPRSERAMLLCLYSTKMRWQHHEPKLPKVLVVEDEKSFVEALKLV
ncbi:MAG: hypothetical protein CM15mP49_20930 [Actinomycetota bacterium]|nr:MAG: hypothetical protein CM15mP49_20930 [Actinomycetota bacterium]